MFPSPTGGPISPDSVLNMLHRVLERAGLPKIRFHDCQHTTATLALQNGVDVKTVSGMLGHYSAGFTPRYLRPRDHTGAEGSREYHGQYSAWEVRYSIQAKQGGKCRPEHFSTEKPTLQNLLRNTKKERFQPVEKRKKSFKRVSEEGEKAKNPPEILSRPIWTFIPHLGHGLGQAEKAGRISIFTPVIASCCLAHVRRVTSSTKLLSLGEAV